VLSSVDPTLSDGWQSFWDDEQADTDKGGHGVRAAVQDPPLSGNGAGLLRSSDHDSSIPSASGHASLGASLGSQQQQPPSVLSQLTRRASSLVPDWVAAKFTPKIRGLVLLNLLVVLVATNWCAFVSSTARPAHYAACAQHPWPQLSCQMLDTGCWLCSCRVVVKESGGINALDFAALRFSIAALAFVPFLPGALRADENGVLLDWSCMPLTGHADAVMYEFVRHEGPIHPRLHGMLRRVRPGNV